MSPYSVPLAAVLHDGRVFIEVTDKAAFDRLPFPHEHLSNELAEGLFKQVPLNGCTTIPVVFEHFLRG